MTGEWLWLVLWLGARFGGHLVDAWRSLRAARHQADVAWGYVVVAAVIVVVAASLLDHKWYRAAAIAAAGGLIVWAAWQSGVLH